MLALNDNRVTNPWGGIIYLYIVNIYLQYFRNNAVLSVSHGAIQSDRPKKRQIFRLSSQYVSRKCKTNGINAPEPVRKSEVKWLQAVKCVRQRHFTLVTSNRPVSSRNQTFNLLSRGSKVHFSVRGWAWSRSRLMWTGLLNIPPVSISSQSRVTQIDGCSVRVWIPLMGFPFLFGCIGNHFWTSIHWAIVERWVQ